MSSMSVGAALAVLAAAEPDPAKVEELTRHPNPAVRRRAEQIAAEASQGVPERQGMELPEEPAPQGGPPKPNPSATGGWSGQTEGTAAPVPAVPTVASHVEPMLRWFRYRHLPDNLAAVSAPFAELAGRICAAVPRCPERTVALRKLLESKDAAVRAALPVE